MVYSYYNVALTMFNSYYNVAHDYGQQLLQCSTDYGQQLVINNRSLMAVRVYSHIFDLS